MINFFKIIVLGIVSAALAILVEQAIATAASIFWHREIVLESYIHFTWFLAVAALLEEISKYWAVAYVIPKKFNLEKTKFVLASLFLGAVWGIFEIGLVLFTNPKTASLLQSGNSDLIFSFSTISALHALTAFLMGIFISTNIFSGRLKHLKVLFFPVLIHLLFNFLIIQKSGFTNYLIVISLGIVFMIGFLILIFNYKKLA